MSIDTIKCLLELLIKKSPDSLDVEIQSIKMLI